MPVDFLKIDREFVTALASSASDRRVVRSLVAVAREFGCATIAEGVEDGATLELLRTFGVDYVQGFHIARPAPARNRASLLRADRPSPPSVVAGPPPCTLRARTVPARLMVPRVSANDAPGSRLVACANQKPKLALQPSGW